MQEPLVTIIMPAYNASRFVGEAIRSVIDQTYPRWELIIVNDGSTDDTEKIVGTFSDLRIQYYSQSNQGVSAARNKGLMHMKGQYLCFLDGDDVLPANSVEARLKPMTDPDVAFVDGKVDVFDTTLTNRLKTWVPSFRGYPIRNLMRLDESCFFGPTWLVRIVPGFAYQFDGALTHGEDLYFYITIAQSGKYTYVEETILQYRKSEVSAMGNLEGLAKGYASLRKKMKFQASDRIVFELKTRKIMLLSFLKAGLIFKALRFLITGN
jgi:teichuronic acid biosynthesis glycosyltransferase TuaG